MTQPNTELQYHDDNSFLSPVLELLKDYDASYVHTGGGIMCIDCVSGDKRYTFGTADTTWAAEVNSVATEAELGYLRTPLASEEKDAGKIAGAIRAAIEHDQGRGPNPLAALTAEDEPDNN